MRHYVYANFLELLVIDDDYLFQRQEYTSECYSSRSTGRDRTHGGLKCEGCSKGSSDYEGSEQINYSGVTVTRCSGAFHL